MKIVPLFCLLLCILSASAQIYKKEIPELLELTSYPKDKDADAFYVYDKGGSIFRDGVDGLELVFARSFRMKILNDDGIDYAEVYIPLYYESYRAENVAKLKVIVYNLEDGEITKVVVDKKDLLEERINDRWMAKKMKIPGVKAGSVIDVGYEVESPYFSNLTDWEFQHEIPVAYSLYQAAMIPFYTYTYILKGTDKLDIAQRYVSSGMKKSLYGIEYQEMIFKFGLYNVKAFKDASFITCEEDYKITLDFQLSSYKPVSGGEIMVMSTWEKLVGEFLKYPEFGRYEKSVRKLAKQVLAENAIVGETQLKTLENAVEYVKQNYKWDYHYGSYSNKSAKQFEKEKTGNCTAMNLFLVALLNEAGIEATPLLISTRDHGKIYSDYPFAHFFNYSIVYSNIDGKSILSDATEPFSSYDQLPVRCINDVGLMIKKGDVAWVKTSSHTSSTSSDHFKITLTSDSLLVDYNYNSTGYEAVSDMRSFSSDSIHYFENISERLFDDLTSSHLRSTTSSKRFSVEESGKKKIEKIENYVAINPFMQYFSKENPFTERERNYPIDFIYPRNVVYVSTVELPENAKIVSLPEDKSISNDAFDLSYTVVTSGKEVNVSMNYRIKKAMYPKEYYLKLKEYFDVYLNAMAQTIQIELGE